MAARKNWKLSVFSLLLLALQSNGLQANSGSDDSWNAGPTRYTPWSTASENCQDWSPSEASWDWGKPVRQSRQCTLTENRHKITTLIHRQTGQKKDNAPLLESRIRKSTSWRTMQGQQDRLIKKMMDVNWSDWRPVPGTISNCELSATSLAARIEWGTPWLQLVQCSASLKRSKLMKEYWLSGKTIPIPTESLEEARVGAFYLARTAMGQQDRWLKETVQESPWQTLSAENCANWPSALLASAKQLRWGDSVLLSRECLLTQQRTEITTRQSLSGKKEVLSTQQAQRTRSLKEWRVVRGEKDEILTGQWVLSQDWHTEPGSWECSAGVPEAIVPYGTPYINYKSCQSNSLRSYEYQAVYRSGVKKVSERKEDRQVKTFPLLTYATGMRDQLIESSAEVRGGDWQVSGDVRCAQWSPSETMVEMNATFVQTRQCLQNKFRTIEKLSRRESGDRWDEIERKEAEFGFVESRYATGGQIATESSSLLHLTTTGGGALSETEKFVIERPSRFTRARIAVNASEGDVAGARVVLKNSHGVVLEQKLSMQAPFVVYIPLQGVADSGSWTVSVATAKPSKLTVHALFMAIPDGDSR